MGYFLMMDPIVFFPIAVFSLALAGFALQRSPRRGKAKEIARAAAVLLLLGGVVASSGYYASECGDCGWGEFILVGFWTAVMGVCGLIVGLLLGWRRHDSPE